MARSKVVAIDSFSLVTYIVRESDAPRWAYTYFILPRKCQSFMKLDKPDMTILAYFCVVVYFQLFSFSRAFQRVRPVSHAPLYSPDPFVYGATHDIQ